MVFVTLITALTLYTYFAELVSWKEIAFGISAYDVQSTYGFIIGSVFSGVIGTGFYPILGNRVWYRFGCPLPAYMGSFKSLNQDLELLPMEGNVFISETVLRIVNRELMYDHTHKRDKISSVFLVLVVEFVLPYVLDEY